MRKLILAWLALLVLLALEFGVSLLHFSPTLRPLLLLPALAMLGIIVSSFMQIGRGPVIVRLFAAAGALWLLILLALGSLDPLTRMNYPVSSQSISGVGN
jgi:cytochrome c oxidase subunit 4